MPHSTQRLGLALLAALTFSGAANAQAIRYISTTGNDASTCTLAAPCRNLQRGINATPAGGELRVLDSGGYGVQGNITKSMTLNGQGNTLLLGGNPNIVVNDPAAIVMLRGLHLNGRGILGTGFFVDAAAAVHVVDCKVERFAQMGIHLLGNNTDFHVAGTIVSDNGAEGLRALGLGPTTVTLDSLLIANNQIGVLLEDVEVSITNSIASGNFLDGISQVRGRSNIVWTTAVNNGRYGFSVSGGGGEMNLEFATGRGNSGAGFRVSNIAGGRISNSTMTDNDTGILNGNVETRGNNTVAGNTTADVTNPGTLVTLPPT